jgi:hypothetical protein
MSVMLLHQKVKDGSVEDAEAAARQLFSALARVQPEGLRYASTRVADSSTFVAVIELKTAAKTPGQRSPNSRGSSSKSRTGPMGRR